MSVAGVAHPVERHLAKVEVASSSLVTRSIKKKQMRKHLLLCLLKKSLKLDVIANQPAMNYGMIATGNHSHF